MFKISAVILLLAIYAAPALAGDSDPSALAMPPAGSAINAFPAPPGKPGRPSRGQKGKGLPTVTITGAKGEDPSEPPAPKRSLDGLVLDDSGTVMPEVTTAVRFSNIDVNRITCSSDIKDVVWSTEKPVKVKWVDKEAYVKFQPLERETDGKLFYTTDPVELFVRCDNTTYQLIAVPTPMPAQTIRLTSKVADNMKANSEMFGAMPFEKKVISLLKTVYTDQIPDSFTVTKLGKQIDYYKELNLTLKRIVKIEGEGLQVKEYVVTLRDPSASRFELDEKMFLKSQLVNRPVAIAIDKLNLIKGAASRLLVVELAKENGQ